MLWKRILFFALLLSLQGGSVWTQSTIEIGAGPCQMKRSYDPETRYDNNFCIEVGYQYSYKLSELWYLKPGLNFMYYRMQYNIVVKHPNPPFPYSTIKHTTHDYVSVLLPLLAEFRIKKFSVFAGPCLEFKFYEEQNGGNYEFVGPYSRTFYNPEFLKHGNTILAQVGVSYRIHPNFSVNAQGSYGKELRFAWLSASYIFKH